MRVRKILTFLAVAAVAAGVPGQLLAANLVTNGNFSSYTTGPNGPGTIDAYTTLTAWSINKLSSPYYSDLLYTGPGDTTPSWNYNPPVPAFYQYLYGPANGSNNGLTGPPGGGNYLAADATFIRNELDQTITGLTPGQTYSLGFDWAGAQFPPYNTPGFTNYVAWQVGFGGTTQTTSVGQFPQEGFLPWAHQTMTFVATAMSQTLSFVAIDGPDPLPPAALLANVTLTSVPEPSAVLLLGLGLAGVGLARRFRKRGMTAAV